jgi:hypothetical protein
MSITDGPDLTPVRGFLYDTEYLVDGTREMYFFSRAQNQGFAALTPYRQKTPADTNMKLCGQLSLPERMQVEYMECFVLREAVDDIDWCAVPFGALSVKVGGKTLFNRPIWSCNTGCEQGRRRPLSAISRGCFEALVGFYEQFGDELAKAALDRANGRLLDCGRIDTLLSDLERSYGTPAVAHPPAATGGVLRAHEIGPGEFIEAKMEWAEPLRLKAPIKASVLLGGVHFVQKPAR